MWCEVKCVCTCLCMWVRSAGQRPEVKVSCSVQGGQATWIRCQVSEITLPGITDPLLSRDDIHVQLDLLFGGLDPQ